MKYSPQFKLECVKKGKNGERGFHPEGKERSQSFMKQVGLWAKHCDKFGMEGLRHSGRQRNWTAEARKSGFTPDVFAVSSTKCSPFLRLNVSHFFD